MGCVVDVDLTGEGSRAGVVRVVGVFTPGVVEVPAVTAVPLVDVVGTGAVVKDSGVRIESDAGSAVDAPWS